MIEKQNEKKIVQPKEAFPRVGKVARQRRMRAKQASVLAHGIPPQAFPLGGGRKTASSLREATDEGETGERAIRATYASEPADTKIPGKPTGSVSFRQGAAYPVRGW
ncbi:MAG: hypothetical protein SOZ51_00880 [Eubacteriales bacterium]|nr:hypothetical protein [Eubacteriales bacterium]